MSTTIQSGSPIQTHGNLTVGLFPHKTFERGKLVYQANRVAVGEQIAVLFCPASNRKVYGVSIDRADLGRVLAFGFWRVANFAPKSHPKDFRLYAYCARRPMSPDQPRTTYLHKFLLPVAPGFEVDHVNRRTTDCRRSENLRPATKSEQQRNRAPQDQQEKRRLGETVTWMCHECKASFGGPPVCPQCGRDVRDGKRAVGRVRITPINATERN